MGFANGGVTVIRGDLIHDRGAKQRTVFESNEPITGVEFRGGRSTTLYLATTNRILTLVLSGKGQGQPARILEESGCAVGCMTVDKKTGDVIVVRDDAIYYYGPNGRGPCFAYEGPKKLIRTYKDYLTIVSPPETGDSMTLNSIKRFGAGGADNIFNTSRLTIFDTDLKYLAHSESLISEVKEIFVEWGDLFVLTMNGKVCLKSSIYRTLIDDGSSIAIARNHWPRSWRYFISVTYTSLQSILPKRLVWTFCN